MPIGAVQAEVLIVGAGPAGLLLAGDLAADGVSVLVLERERGGSLAPGEAMLHARALEQLDIRGIADRLVDTGRSVTRLDIGPVSLSLGHLPSRFPFALVTAQHELRSLLAARAMSLGARVLPGVQVAGLRQDSAGTQLLATERGRPARSYAAPYLVGADGADSAVRTALGPPLIGPPLLGLPGGWRQAPRLVVGRVLLAGEAAHTDPEPGTGGPGLEAGLQDAANLSWKLAAVLRGTAGPVLLGSYHDERSYAVRRLARLCHALGAPRRSWSPLLGEAAAAVLLAGPLADRAARAVAGLSLAYPTGAGSHRLAGRRAPDVPLAEIPPSDVVPLAGGGPWRLHEALGERRPVLLVDLAALASTDLAALLALWPGRVTVAAPAAAGPARVVLVRPDGYVAWATDTRAPTRRYSGLRQALSHWCGPPAADGRVAALS